MIFRQQSKMLTDTTKLHFAIVAIVSLAFVRVASTTEADPEFEKSMDVLIGVYGNYFPEERSLNSVDLGQFLDDRVKRVLSDYGYGSRLQAGENIANSFAHEGLFGASGPGKRHNEMKDFNNNVEREMSEKDKRVETDYGYGSRVQAGENVAMDWDRNGLFGMHGPGKRNDIPGGKELDLTKRVTADFGYGSRSRAAENAAKSTSSGEVFGVYGPGKRNKRHA